MLYEQDTLIRPVCVNMVVYAENQIFYNLLILLSDFRHQSSKKFKYGYTKIYYDDKKVKNLKLKLWFVDISWEWLRCIPIPDPNPAPVTAISYRICESVRLISTERHGCGLRPWLLVRWYNGWWETVKWPFDSFFFKEKQDRPIF